MLECELEKICLEYLFEGLLAQNGYTMFNDVYENLVNNYVPRNQFSETPKRSNRRPRGLKIQRKMFEKRITWLGGLR